MRKYITSVLLTIAIIPVLAQVTTPLSLREGAGVRLYTLEQLKDSARHNNITLRNAQRSVASAAQQRKEAFTKYFPNVSGTGFWFNANKGMARMDVNPSQMIPAEIGAAMAQQFPAEALAALQSPISMSMLKNGTVAGVNAVQPVFAGGQIVNSNKLARVGEEAARLQLELSDNEVERQTEQYYWQLVSLQEKLKTIAAVDTLLGDIYKDVDVAVRAGLVMRNDLLQVQLRRNDIESQRIKLQNGISIVRLLLTQYCGLDNTDFTLVTDMKAIPPMIHPQDYGQALLSTPEYQLLGKQIEAAKLQKNIAVGQQLPTVAVGAGYNYHNLLDNNRMFGMIFATVSVPISDWWGGFHAIKRKKIEYEKAIDEQRDKAQLLQIRMQNAYNNVVEARQQLDIAQRSIEQSEENLRLHRNFYKAGTTKMSDLLEAQLLYQQSLDRRTDAYAELQNKILEYRQATGQ